MSELHEIIKLAAQVVLLRKVDVLTENGDLATTDVDALLRLDYALAETFNLTSDNVNFENIDDLLDKINWMASSSENNTDEFTRNLADGALAANKILHEQIKTLEQQLKAAKELNESMFETINHINSMEDSYNEPEDVLAEILLTANIARCEYASSLEGK